MPLEEEEDDEDDEDMIKFVWSEEEQRHGHHTRVPQFLLFPGAGKRRAGPLITVQPHPIVTF